MPRGLCIGGPLDGKWKTAEASHLYVPRKYSDGPITEGPITYTIKVFRTDETGFQYIWVFNALSTDQAVRRLLMRYRP